MQSDEVTPGSLSVRCRPLSFRPIHRRAIPIAKTTDLLTPADRKLARAAMAKQAGKGKCRGQSVIREKVSREPILDANGKRQFKPCRNDAILGGYVCLKHGGNAPQVKARAARRLVALVETTLDRLVGLRDQNDHLPTAMMATKEILNRAGGAAIGPVDPQGGKMDTRPIINIGIRVGGINPPQLEGSAVVVDNDDSDR